MRTEKKSAYVRVLVATNELTSAVESLWRATGQADATQIGIGAAENSKRLSIACEEAQMVASDWMQFYIGQVAALATILLPATIYDGRDQGYAYLEKLTFARATLVNAMREDLRGAASPAGVQHVKMVAVDQTGHESGATAKDNRPVIAECSSHPLMFNPGPSHSDNAIRKSHVPPPPRSLPA